MGKKAKEREAKGGAGAEGGKPGVEARLRELLEGLTASAKSVGPDDGRAMGLWREREAQALGEAGRAIQNACAQGEAGFGRALKAAEALMGKEGAMRPLALAMELASAALGEGLAPERRARRVAELAGCEALWSPQSPLARSSGKALRRIEWRREDKLLEALARIAAGAARLGRERPEAAVEAGRVAGRLLQMGERGWGDLARAAGPQILREARAAKGVGEGALKGLPAPFWLALSHQTAPGDALRGELLGHLMRRAKGDPWLKDQLCLAVWSGLGADEIRAFEAAFPGESKKALGRALRDGKSQEWRGPGAEELCGGLIPRVAGAAGRPEGAWARPLAEAMRLGPNATGMGGVGGRDPRAKAFFEALWPLWEAEEIRWGMGQGRAPAGGSKSAPRL